MRKLILLLFAVILISPIHSQSLSNINANIVAVKYSAASAWGDYDNDGLLDLVICGEPDGGIDTTLLYHNNGDDTFTAIPNPGFIHVTIGDVEWGDFNNDGNLDLIVIGTNNYISVLKLYINNGDGTFSEETSSGLPGVYMGDIDFSDFNNDGYLDVGISGFDNNYLFITKVFENNHDLTFTELPGLNLEGLNFGKFKWGDYNGDGYADFVINGFGDETYVTQLWKNNGNETFTEQGFANLHQGWLGDMEWGDFDNDDDLDLVISGTGGDGSERFTIIYKNNNGIFTEVPATFLPAVSHSSLEWGDFDGDGDLDLFIAGTLDGMGTGNYVGEIRYNNDGNFSQTESFIGTYWGDCNVADYDNSGFPDLFICGYDVNEDGTAEIFKNDRVLSVSSQNAEHTKIGPSPAIDFIQINSKNQILSVDVLNLNGELVKQKSMNNKNGIIDVKDLASGSYFLRILYDSSEEIRKFTVIN